VSGRDLWLLVAVTVGPALAIAWAACWLVRGMAPRLGLVDRPGARKVHDKPMPTAGGLGIWLGVVAPLAAAHLLVAWSTTDPATATWLPAFIRPHLAGLLAQFPKLWLMLGGGSVLLVLGLIDDRHGLDWRVRLGVQTLVATGMVAAGWRLTIFLPWTWLTAPLSALWIVGLINSFNMLDNMDGLSAGVGAIAAAILAAVMLTVPDPATSLPHLFVGSLLLVLVGSLLGFLGHNRPPARLFMGDAGAYFLGYLVAMCTLAGTFAGGSLPRHSVLAPLCALAVPLYDTTSVVLLRLRSGRSPFVGDKSHFSHRLVELGLTKPQAVLTIYLATATCGLAALLLHQVDTVGAAVVLLLVAMTLTLVAVLELAARKRLP